MNALNWPALIAEALRRRKAERMTQKEHAALADVSIPTIVAFDKGERTLSLNKAFDILRVVGLVEEPVLEDAQDVFVREAFERWRTLTAVLPETSPGRFPHGWYRIDYALEGDLKEIKPRPLIDVLDRAMVRHTARPMFCISQPDGPAPTETNGLLECRYAPVHIGRGGVSRDPADYDFWRADPAGRMFFIRGYLEDAQETMLAGTIFDAIWPIWRLGEALMHAANLAAALSNDEAAVTIRLRALYAGLTGRVLRAWANPRYGDFLIGNRPSRSDEALLEIAVPARDVRANIGQYVLTLTAPLFERFGIPGLPANVVDAELTQMQNDLRWSAVLSHASR